MTEDETAAVRRGGARTERDLMLAGEPYQANDPDLAAERRRARRLMRALNATTEEEMDRRRAILADLFGSLGSNAEVEPPFYCDYGWNIRAGSNLFLNFGCVILDCNRVTIGSNVFIGPYVQIYAATHPTDPELRRSGRELAIPVTIGDDVWIGGGAIIGPGVTIGDGTTVGAGSVVTRSLPPRVVAAGSPCRILRHLEDDLV